MVYHIYIENPKIENVFVSSSSPHFSIYKGHFKTHDALVAQHCRGSTALQRLHQGLQAEAPPVMSW